MKKKLSLMLALAMTLGLCACGSSTSSDVANVEETKTSDTVVFEKPGTYTATAAGRNGDVTLTVEFSDTAIVSINVDSEETETIGVSAMDTLVEQVIGSQSVAVDTVSGATLSTEAFIECLNSCVEQAGGNMELLGGEITSEKVSYETEADVIVVGAGGAGLMAALTAANDGASVILLEKSSSIGGNTLCAANGINAYDSDVQLADETYQAADTSVEEFEALQTNERSRIELVDAFINNSAEAINYLSDLGVDFTVEISEDERNTDSNYYLLKSEEDGTTTMTTIINALSTALDASGVVLYKNTEATSLVQDENGNVTGVNAIGENEEELTFTGKSVVLCTGGFGKNNELIAQVAPDYANCITDELAPTTGDGLIMATEIGAEAVDLDQIQTFPAVISGYGMILPMNLPGGFGLNGTIYVNNAGERFAAEAFEIPDAILAQENGEVYAVFTEENLNDTMKELMGIGYVVSADSAEELASQLGVDADGLKASIDTWNADAASNGTDSAFGRENITPLEGTLYGYKFGVGAHYFMGGILIDENTCVLNTDGSIIDGLYAAGEVTGGFHGTQRVDGSGTGDSIVFGMIAGHSAAAAAQN